MKLTRPSLMQRRMPRRFKMLLLPLRKIWKSNKQQLTPPNSTRNQVSKSPRVQLKLRSKRRPNQRKLPPRNSSQLISRSHGEPQLRSGLPTCQSTTSHSASRKKVRSRPSPKMKRKTNLSPRTNPRTKTLAMSPTNE